MPDGITIRREIGGVRPLAIASRAGCNCLGNLYLQRDENGKIMPAVVFGAAVKIFEMYLKHLSGKRGGYSLEGLRMDKDVIDVISALTGTITKRRMTLQLAVIGLRTHKLPRKSSRDWLKIVNDLMPELE